MLNQSAGSLMVGGAKTRRNPGYGIGLKSGWDRHFGTQFERPKKIQKLRYNSPAYSPITG
jgi:hypothetical protein